MQFRTRLVFASSLAVAASGTFVAASGCSSTNSGAAPSAIAHEDAAAMTGVATPDATTGTDGSGADEDAGFTDAAILDPATVDAGFGGPAPALTANVTVHVAGDSTAAIFPSSDPRVGWAAVLQGFFTTGVTIDDEAVSGASSKSFYDQGYWATLMSRIKPGDYVFIEFAHNDEKTTDPTLGTDPNTSYPYYLKTFIGGARQMGGYPVLLTSICRRYFVGNVVIGTHGAYTTALKAVGVETGTPVIDLETLTGDWLTVLGPVASIPMFAPADDTHLSAVGAPQVAELAVEGIMSLGLPIATRLVSDLDAEVGALTPPADASIADGSAVPPDGGTMDSASE